MIQPSLVLLGLVIGAGTWAFLVGAMLIGGGVAAVRRQSRLLGLAAVLFVALAVAVPVLEQLSGGSIGIVLLGLSVLSIGARLRQRRREAPELTERRAAAMRSPRVRWLLAGWLAFLVLITILAAAIGRMSAN